MEPGIFLMGDQNFKHFSPQKVGFSLAFNFLLVKRIVTVPLSSTYL